jgi:Prophage tail length tape measure protein
MATETEIYRILVETQGGRELLQLNRNLEFLNKEVKNTTESTNNFSNSMNALGKTTRSVGQRNNALTNVAYQISDIAVQLEMGTDAGRIFAQQMPQLFGGFGLLGAAVGALAAIIPTAIKLLGRDMTDALKTVKKQLEESNEVLNEYIRISKLAAGSSSVLQEEFGSSSDAVKAFVGDLKKLNEIKLADELDKIATTIGELVAGEGLLQGGRTRMQKVRDDLLEINSSVGSANRQPIIDFLNLLDELENPATEDSRRIEIFADLNARVKEAAGSVEDMTADQRAFIEATALVALQYEKTVAAQKTGLSLAYEQYGASKEISRQAEIQAETEKRRVQQGYEQYYALRQMGEQEQANAEYAANTAKAYKQYYDSLKQAVKLESSAERTKQAYQLYYTTRQISAEMDASARAAASFAGQLANAYSQAARVHSAIADLKSLTGSLSLSNIGLEAQLNALRSGATEEYARAAGDFAEQEKKLSDALVSATTTGEIQAASAALESYRGQQKLRLDTEEAISAELEKRRATSAGGSGGGGASESAEELKELTNALKEYRTESEKDALELQRLQELWNRYGASLAGTAEYAELMKRAQQELGGATSDLKEEMENLAEVTGSAIGQGLADIAFGAKSASDAFKEMAQTILQELGKILAKWLTFKILTAGFGFNVQSPFSVGARTVAGPALPSVQGFARIGSTSPVTSLRSTDPYYQPKMNANDSQAPVVIVNNNAAGTVATARTEGDRTYVTIEEVQDLVAGAVIRGGNAISQSIERTYRVNRAR